MEISRTNPLAATALARILALLSARLGVIGRSQRKPARQCRAGVDLVTGLDHFGPAPGGGSGGGAAVSPLDDAQADCVYGRDLVQLSSVFALR